MKGPSAMRIGNANNFFRACQAASIILGILLVGSCIAFRIGLDAPRASFTTTPIALREYRGNEALPPTSTNIYWATAGRGFVGFVDMYRFDAPPADCIAYGKRLLKKNDPFWDAELTPIVSSPEPMGTGYIDSMGLSQVKWFNIETVRSGFIGHRDAGSHPRMTFWIDTDRGRFYYYSSD
jgi:hypothetical protein